MNTNLHNPRRRVRGFTLMELLVVIGIIALIAGLAVPTIATFMTAGSDSQAYNLLVAMLSAARAQAVQTHNYTAVHIQCQAMNDLAGPPVGKCYVALFQYDKTTGLFKGNTDYEPKPLPGGMAFGEGSDYFLGTGGNALQNLTNANMQNFTSFSIVFNPNGSIVRNVPLLAAGDTGMVKFLATDPYFAAGTTQLWYDTVANNSGAVGEPGARCVWIFKMNEFMAINDTVGTTRSAWLIKNGQEIPLNCNTGQLFPRE